MFRIVIVITSHAFQWWFLDVPGSATLLTELRATNQHVSTAKLV